MTDLKTIQDWVLQRRFKAVPGVIDVTGWGGKTKTYDIIVDLDRLLAHGLTLKQVLDGLGNANINVGANTVNIGPQSAIVRSVGQIRSMDDIRNTMLSARRRRAGAGVRRRHRDGRQPARGSASPARTTTTTSSRASC